MTQPYYDPQIFLLDHDLDKELLQQTLEIMNFIMSNYEFSGTEDEVEAIIEKLDAEKYALVKQAFVDVVDKYRDNQTISIQSIKDKLAEYGYLYLTEIFETTDEQLRILASYLPLIQILKGTLPGLELIMTLLHVGLEIVEWWEDPENLEILSYVLSLELVNQPVSTQLLPRVKKFSREYVYPLLTNIVYSITYKLNKTPIISAAIYSKTAIKVWQQFLWLIWAGEGETWNNWTDQAPFQSPPTHKSLWQGDTGTELVWESGATEEKENLWSSTTDPKDYRVWQTSMSQNLAEDEELLEWWIESTYLFGGKPEECWCVEDPSVEEPLYTYWSPDDSEEAIKVTLMIEPTPADSIVEINGEITKAISVLKNSEVIYRVYNTRDTDYITTSGSLNLTEDTILPIKLIKPEKKCTVKISSKPSSAKIILQDYPITNSGSIKGSTGSVSATVGFGTHLYWNVSAENYVSKSGDFKVEKDLNLNVELDSIPTYTLTIIPDPADSLVKIDGKSLKSVEVLQDTKVSWSVSKDHYISQSGSQFMMGDKTLEISLEKQSYTAVLEINVPSNIAFSGNIESQTLNSVTAKYGTAINCTIIPIDSMYRSKTTTFTIDENKTIDIYLEKKEASEVSTDLFTFEATSSSDAYQSGSFTTGWKYDSSDNSWNGSTFIAVGPCTIETTIKSTHSRTNYSDCNGLTVKYNIGNASGQRIEYGSSGAEKVSYTYSYSLAEGETLYYIEGISNWGGSGSSVMQTPSTVKTSIQVRKTEIVYS